MNKPAVELRSFEFREIFRVGEDGLPEFKVFLAGGWESATEWMEITSPIDGSIIGRAPITGRRAIERVLREMYEKGRWEIRDDPGEKRLATYHKAADLLERFKEEFAAVLTVNSGKTAPAALGEVNASIERLRRSDLDTRQIVGDYIPGDWSEETLETEAVIRREPIGLVLAIVPFNYPLFDAVNKLVYSSIVGNATVVKPASSTPIPSLMFARLLELAGLPKRSFAVITMPGRDTGTIVRDHRVAGISLTGSTETGVKLLKTAGIKQFVMELGGGDPAIVLEDAELPRAAQRIGVGITSYAGQRCDAIKLILAEKPIYRDLRREIIGELRKVKVGDPREEKTTMGPLIDEEAVLEFVRGVEDAVQKGGRIIHGGSRTQQKKDTNKKKNMMRKGGNNYIQPTLIEVSKENVSSMMLYKDEIFAAVSLMMPIENIEEAISIANGRRYGLDAAVFGKDVNKIRRLTRRLDVGAIYVNDNPRHGIGYYPFGGRKDSGIGREGIGYTIDYVTSHKSVVYNYKGKGVWEYL